MTDVAAVAGGSHPLDALLAAQAASARHVVSLWGPCLHPWWGKWAREGGERRAGGGGAGSGMCRPSVVGARAPVGKKRAAEGNGTTKPRRRPG
jgi:hypothetical protein